MDQIKATDPTAQDPARRRVRPAILKAWRERMGYSAREACLELDCSRGAWAHWEQAGAPRYIGLAMAALALGMSDYGGKPPAGDAQ